MFDRLWQPSTVIAAPLTQLDLGDARKQTTLATSSARPKRPKGSSRLTNSAIPWGSDCCRLCHEPPGKRIEPGQTLTLADLEGPGAITHIWCTVASEDPFYGRSLVLRIYWDDAETPSVCPKMPSVER